MSLLSEVSKTVLNAQLVYTKTTGSLLPSPSPSLVQPYVQTGTPVLIPDMLSNRYGLGAFDENTTTFAFPVARVDNSAIFHIFTNSAVTNAPPQFTLAATIPIAGATTFGYMFSAISHNGLVYAVTAPNDNILTGALFVFTRPTITSQVWSQVATVYGAASGDTYGSAVSMSADGSVIAVGVPNKNGGVGETNVYNFDYATGVLSPVVTTLVGTDAVGPSNQGYAVKLSGDGQTVAVGGSNDAGGVGAVWMFKYNSTTSTWSQTGSKLVPLTPNTFTGIGGSVSLSYDGTTLAIASLTPSIVFLYFLNDDGTWVQRQTIYPLGVAPLGQTYAVALNDNGNVLTFDDWVGRGGVFVYNRQPDGLWVQNGAQRVATGELITQFLYLSAMSPSGSMFASVPTSAPPVPGNPIVFTIFQ